MSEDVPTLTVNGRTYGGWTSLRVGRGLDRCASDFEAEITERWIDDGQEQGFVILPFQEAQIKLGPDPVLTGYIDAFVSTFDARRHTVHVRGRSRTEDLVDCSPDIQSGQFKGYTLEAIVRSLCALFKIEVVVQTDAASQIVADATIERCETAFTFIERLCRLAGVLATDDPLGRLVLTRAGVQQASGRLEWGKNIIRGEGHFNVHNRFSDYIVKGQHGTGGGTGGGGLDLSQFAGPGPAVYSGKSSPVVTNQHAAAHDDRTPRYRPHVTLAESQLTQAQAQLRANWQRAYAFGRSYQFHADVAGWRQPDGSLWQLNQLVSTTSPGYLGIDGDLLVAHIEYTLDDRGGRQTRMMLGPVEGYTPDPGQVRIHKKRGRKGRKGAGLDLSGFGDGGGEEE